MTSITITPKELDEMGLEKDGSVYVVVGNPPIYIGFWGDGSARVHVVAAPGQEVYFPYVTSMERLKMLLDAIGENGEENES